MSGRAESRPASSPLGGSWTPGSQRFKPSHFDAGIKFVMTAIEGAAGRDVCVYGQMKSAPVVLSLPRVTRVVHRYYKFGIQSGQSLLDFLGEHLHISAEMRDRMVRHHGWERALMYFDPTGEAAVRNVTRKDGDD